MANEDVKILVVDDEEDLCEILQFNLEGEGFRVDLAYSAEDAIQKGLYGYDLFLLDIMMGKMSGFKLAEKIRNELKIQAPIVFLTAKNTENDLLTGFSLGGDDYITKPFSVKEVIARIKAILTRISKESISAEKKTIRIKDIELNHAAKQVFIKDKEIELTKKEYEIFSLLIEHKGKTLSRETIMRKVWGQDVIVTERTIDVHLTRLRKKIGKYGNNIKSKHGYGYAFKI